MEFSYTYVQITVHEETGGSRNRNRQPRELDTLPVRLRAFRPVRVVIKNKFEKNRETVRPQLSPGYLHRGNPRSFSLIRASKIVRLQIDKDHSHSTGPYIQGPNPQDGGPPDKTSGVLN